MAGTCHRTRASIQLYLPAHTSTQKQLCACKHTGVNPAVGTCPWEPAFQFGACQRPTAQHQSEKP